MKKSLLALAIFSSAAMSSDLPTVKLDKSTETQIGKYVNRNSQSVTYFQAAHDLVGVGVVTKDFKKNIFYTNENGDFLLSGVLIDSQSASNLTAQYAEHLQIDLGDIPAKAAQLKGVEQGSGDNEIYAIIDINCGYCHRMWNQMQTILDNPNSNVKVKWITVGFLGKQSAEVAQHVSGMEDNAAALELLSQSMRRQSVTTSPDVRVKGKQSVDDIHSFMQDNSFGGVPLVISKINGDWNLSPGAPSSRFFADLIEQPAATNNESISD